MKSQKIVSLNPSINYQVIGEIEPSSYADIDAKVSNARKAFALWSGFSLKQLV